MASTSTGDKTAKIGESFEKIYGKLPESIRSSATESQGDDRSALVSYLRENLGSSEHPEIEAELKKTFPLRKTKVDRKAYKKKKPPKNQIRKSNKFLTSRERRDLGLFQLVPSYKNGKNPSVKYADFEDLRNLWKDYMRELLDLPHYEPKNFKPDSDPLRIKVCRADYHGARLKVTKSLVGNNVGLEGMVLMETRNTFQILTESDALKTIPKNKTSFTFKLDGYQFTLDGSIMDCKPSERAVKKWKNKGPLDF